ncbi:MAG: beta-glucuronidase [Prevotella sp.]|nr:beta-glucuronidase [Prevotella sp.]
MKRKYIIYLLCLLSSLSCPAQQIISLAGAWDFAIGDEPATENKKRHGSEPRRHYDDFVILPGSMLTNDKGDPVSLSTPWTGSLYDSSYYFNPRLEPYRQEGNMKFPFFLTPERHYVGAAWYKKKIYIPKHWKGERITLFLERPHIETTVFVNGHEVDHQSSLSTPHIYDVSDYIKAGRQNEIAIRVYNGIENVGVGQDSHSVTDQTQGNWNGIAGRIELRAQWKKLNIRKVTIIPAPDLMSFKVIVDIENHTPYVRVMPLYDYMINATVQPIVDGQPAKEILRHSSVIGSKNQIAITFPSEGSYTLIQMKGRQAKSVLPWDEFRPNLYKLTIEVGDDVYETTFGIRHISIEDRQLYINGRPLFLRGTVECCCFPETGYPPMEKDEWLRIFRKCKEYGLNHMRFHSYCPPEAAFQAADEVGIYLQPEGPSWPNHGVKLRSGQPIDQYLLEESQRIVDTYGHHPSFVMMAAGNEPAGDWVAYCNDWVRQMHDYDSTKVYCGASVGGGWAWDDGSEYHVKGGARGLDWDRRAPQSDDDYYEGIVHPRNFKPTVKEPEACSPIIAHEQGQWCAFPDFKEISDYTGVYKARNLELFRDLLAQGGMSTMAEKFLMASGRLQTLCYKFEIERNLRTKDYAGFQLLSLNDYSGQGSALVGPLNVHWQEKGYVNARRWKEFCNSLVIMARFPKFVYTNDERLHVPVVMTNALYAPLKPFATVYEIWCDDNTLFCRDTLSTRSVPIGKCHDMGTIDLPLDSIKRPTKMILRISLANTLQNEYDFWVYPTPGEDEKPYPFLICDSLTSAALDTLRAGGSVLLTAAGKVTLGSDVKQHYLPAFWNTSWFKMRPPHTTGAYIDKHHPLFKYDFPTDDWSNLNWWELLNRAQVMNLMELPLDYQSPIQPIDTWHISRKLGMLVEARVLGGRLLMTTMDISNDLEHRPVARQMRHAICSYMQSADFQPTLTLSPEVISHFFTRQATAVDMHTVSNPDELKPKLK